MADAAPVFGKRAPRPGSGPAPAPSPAPAAAAPFGRLARPQAPERAVPSTAPDHPDSRTPRSGSPVEDLRAVLAREVGEPALEPRLRAEAGPASGGAKIVAGLEMPESWSNPPPAPKPLAGVASFFGRAISGAGTGAASVRRAEPAVPPPELPRGPVKIVDGLEMPDSWTNPPPAPKPLAGVTAFIGRSVGDVPDGPAESLWRSYFKACVAAFATGLILTGVVLDGGEEGPDLFLSRLFMNLASGVVMASMAPALAPFIRIAADVLAKIGLKRGWSDVLIGAAFGSLMMLPDLATGHPPKLMALCFVVGGAFGGFVFWRTRGYPGLNTDQRRFAEGAHIVMGKTRDHI